MTHRSALRPCSAPTALTPPATRPVPAGRVPQRAGLIASAAAVILAGCVVAPPAPLRGPLPPGWVTLESGPQPARPPAQPAAPVYFYPERGQPEAQQERDRYECYRWAVRETGTDPGMTPIPPSQAVVLPPAPRAQRDGASVVGGAVTGAVVGAAVSSPRQAGNNAVIGAVFGALLGAASQESRAQAAEQAQARRQAMIDAADAAVQRPLDNFRRAMSVCMQGRGYRAG